MFMRVGTQWRTGIGGITGLDYSPLFSLMDMEGLSRDEWELMFGDIRYMENVALETARESHS